MRYKVIGRSRIRPCPFMIRLEDGRLLYDPLMGSNRTPTIGETGTLEVQKNGRLRLKPDAVDLESSPV